MKVIIRIPLFIDEKRGFCYVGVEIREKGSKNTMENKSFEIIVEQEDKIQRIKVEEEEVNLLKTLREENIYVPALCNGYGSCGKCRVRLNKNSDITEADRKIFSQKELEAGWRLSCKAQLKEETYVRIPISEEKITVEGEQKEGEAFLDLEENQQETFFIAVDIGTTTLAMALTGYETKKVYGVHTGLNHQRAFGADVINRIAAANQGRLEELKNRIEEDLWQGITSLILDRGIEGKRLKKVLIAGNTTMIHLLMGYSCESLGAHPFHSNHLKQWNGTLQEAITCAEMKEYGLEHVKLMLFPGVSAFVGGDIVSGLQLCSSFETEELSFLLDLGTNGEMVLGNKEKMYCTSAAAGPAFEGGNITCGTGSIPGAISKVKIQNKRAIVKTIGENPKVKGICGTGIVSAIAELKNSKLMNKEGTLQFPFSRQGFPLWNQPGEEKICLYQQDIRQFQMAKAAIRTGVEQLIQYHGCDIKEIKKVYLAGGFGTKLSVEDAIDTGILPEEFRGKVEGIGNGALYGAIAYELREDKPDLNEYCEKIENISLALSEGFQEKYLEYMNFLV